MKYSHFEILALGVGVVAVLVTIITSGTSTASEIIGQALIIVPLVGGLHFGRRGGVVSFLAAVVAYGLVSLFMVEDTSLSFQLFIFRTVIYGIVALIAGELNVRLKYLFMRLEHSEFVDSLTTLYNGTYMARLIKKYVSEFDRYGSEFSLGILEIDTSTLAPLKKKERDNRIKDTGCSIIKPGVRGTDEAGRLEDGKFLLIFPRTKKDGALTALERLRSKVGYYLEAQGLETEGHKKICIESYEWPDDMQAINSISVDLPGDNGTRITS